MPLFSFAGTHLRSEPHGGVCVSRQDPSSPSLPWPPCSRCSLRLIRFVLWSLICTSLCQDLERALVVCLLAMCFVKLCKSKVL